MTEAERLEIYKKVDQFNELWIKVSWRFHSPVSPLLSEIYKCTIQYLESKNEFARSNVALRISTRIANHQEFIYTGTSNISIVTGEWHVTNNDLRFWADMCFFGNRDYFPKQWSWIDGGVGRALHQKRRYQAWQGYKGVTDDHRKLLSRVWWQTDYSRQDWASLFVEGKRPMGNSDREGDMIDALGWPAPWWDEDGNGEMQEEIIERLWCLWDELPFALADILKLQKP